MLSRPLGRQDVIAAKLGPSEQATLLQGRRVRPRTAVAGGLRTSRERNKHEGFQALLNIRT